MYDEDAPNEHAAGPDPAGAPPVETAESAALPEELSSDEKTMAMLCHVMSFCGLVFPLGDFIGPLIIWLMRKDVSAFVDDHGRESLNFQITVTIALICCVPLIFVCVGVPLMIAIAIGELILVIVAAVNAAGGNYYRYPMTIRFIR